MPDDNGNSPDGGENNGDPNTPRELAKARADAKRYREEAERLRGDLDHKTKEADGLRGKLKQVQDESEASKADRLKAEGETKAQYEASLNEAKESAKQRLIEARLEARAVRAGVVDDLDALKLLPLDGVNLDDAGRITLPDGYFDRVKEAKPYLFGQAPSNTSQTNPAPKPADTKPVRATEMTADQAAELERRILRTGRAA